MVDGPHEIWVVVDGERFQVQVEDLHQRPVVAYVEGARFEVEIEDLFNGSGAGDDPAQQPLSTASIPGETSCAVTAPMPGDIIQIHVKVGQKLKTGDPLCVLDAMKMKNVIHAPQDGAITEIYVSEGQAVEYGVPLFKLG